MRHILIKQQYIIFKYFFFYNWSNRKGIVEESPYPKIKLTAKNFKFHYIQYSCYIVLLHTIVIVLSRETHINIKRPMGREEKEVKVESSENTTLRKMHNISYEITFLKR